MTEAQRLIKASGLPYREVAARLGVAESTVISWMRPPTSKAHRTPPEPVIRLMRSVL